MILAGFGSAAVTFLIGRILSALFGAAWINEKMPLP